MSDPHVFVSATSQVGTTPQQLPRRTRLTVWLILAAICLVAAIGFLVPAFSAISAAAPYAESSPAPAAMTVDAAIPGLWTLSISVALVICSLIFTAIHAFRRSIFR